MEEKKAEKDKNLSLILIALVVLTGLVNFVAVKALNNEEISLDEVQKVVAEEIAKIEIPEPTVPITTEVAAPTPISEESPKFTLTKAEFEEQEKEAKALELATEEIMSNTFKKEVKLEIEKNQSLESYKDITEVRIKDSKYNETDDSVKFELIVYFFTDGDEDNTMKAYLDNVKVNVTSLDFDENFEDAEAILDKLSLIVTKYKEI